MIEKDEGEQIVLGIIESHKGCKLSAIIAKLRECNILCRGKPWHHGTLRRILQRVKNEQGAAT
jgi:hypothetical protein